MLSPIRPLSSAHVPAPRCFYNPSIFSLLSTPAAATTLVEQASAAPSPTPAMADPAEHREEEEEAAAAGEEEDTGAQIAPIVKLEEVAITTGEEDEDVLLDM